MVVFCATLEIITFLLKPAVANFWATLELFGLPFIPTSCHTGCYWQSILPQLFELKIKKSLFQFSNFWLFGEDIQKIFPLRFRISFIRLLLSPWMPTLIFSLSLSLSLSLFAVLSIRQPLAWQFLSSCSNKSVHGASVIRLGDLLDNFGQLFKAFGNN